MIQALALLPLLATAGDEPRVAAFDRFHRGSPGVEGGLLLLGELGCVACHDSGPLARHVARKEAPRLDAVAARADPAWLRAYLLAPARAQAGTTMPDAFGALPEARREAAADELVHFLVSLAPGAFAREAVDRGAVERGEEGWHQLGCFACHGPRAEGVPIDEPGLRPLGALEEKWSHAGLAAFLRDPLAVRPSGRMPDLALAPREASDVAHFLLQRTRVPGPLAFEVRLGRFERLDDVALAAPERTGVTDAVGFAVAPRQNDVALVFAGWLAVERAGRHGFHLASDHLARLSLDGQVALEVESPGDGIASRDAELELAAGARELRIEAIRRGGPDEPTLTLEWTPPGGERGALPVERLRCELEPVAPPAPWIVDAARAARGRERYASLGCARCHGALDGAGETEPGAARAPALLELAPDRGCLDPRSTAEHPRWSLDGAQRAALGAAFPRAREALSGPDAATRVARTLERLDCGACHERDGRGGPLDLTREWFSATTDDPLDEARLPPGLDGAGDKLRPAALADMLENGTRWRVTPRARMPRFGPANLGALAEDLIALDRSPSPLPAVEDTPEVQREAGRALVGRDGMGCISCHVFHGRRAEGVQSPDLIGATARLNPDWFHRYLRDPEAFKPGTRMSAFWPNGVSAQPGILDGDAGRQVAAIWTYLADGERAVLPEGLSRREVELVVGGEAVVYRGKLRDAGMRGIAVGLPERLNVAYDAEELRLAALWKGRFLNAGPHWTIQGMGRIGPLGTDVVTLAAGPDFALLADGDGPWPAGGERAVGQRFRGYDIGERGHPTLRWDVGPVRVRDAPRAVEAGEGRTVLRRRLEIVVERACPELRMRLLRAETIEELGGGAWRTGEGLTLRVQAPPGAVARLVESGGARELRLDLPLAAGTERATIDYEWGGR